MKQTILDMDATTLAVKIKSGEITSEEATNTYIDHLQHVNPQLNAMVETRFDDARAEAKKCDEQIRNGLGKGKLFGVPISVKESFDAKGMKTTEGLLHRANHVATKDAYVVAKLLEEGAIILGKTNTPTLCMCQETDNKVYGRTNNPWDLTRTVGGSSGGEGAIIAVGGAAVGIGADIGGSIRFPAHFNGIIGFKSGNEQVSDDGLFPETEHPLQRRMLGIGAMAKSVDDAEMMNDIIARELPNEVVSSSYKLIFPPVHPKYPMGAETLQLIEEMKSFFSNLYEVEESYPPSFERVALLWQLFMSIGGGKKLAKKSVGSSTRAVTQYIKEITTSKSDTHRYLSWALIGMNLFKPNAKQVEQFHIEMQQLDKDCERYMDHAVMVLPVYHRTALPHGELYKEIFSIRKTYLKYMPYNSVANVLGLPALTIPVGTDKDGLPIAVQLISSNGNEKALFHFGRIIEQQFRGYVRCTKLD
ncbi:MAG: amidase [Bacilli bacterium]